ncbi:hypothetical protein [Anatilimnocola floriformis]|uniref:hypothetical protein n=1 Tax=Anatilimnocola floriformis TaxID=2948575 RepID=UPI0020C320AB|nr:hypothetical protein [Anatilimnocola floriformis]
MPGPARSAPPIANRLELPLGEGYALRVDFDRAHDRWQHRVFLVVPANSEIVGPVLLLESIEGTADDDWPISPPLQFVSIETRPKQLPVALLMGMSGDGHWSASIEQLAADQTLRFDIACRAKSRPANLGSRYRIGPRVENAQQDNSVQLRVGKLTLEFMGEQAKDSPLPTIQLQEKELHTQFNEPVQEGAQTYRWIYRLRAIPAS